MSVHAPADVSVLLAAALKQVENMPRRNARQSVRTTDPGTSVDAAVKATDKQQAQAIRFLRALAFIEHPATSDDVAQVVIAVMQDGDNKRLWRSEGRISSDLLAARILVRVGRDDGRSLVWFPMDPAHPEVLDFGGEFDDWGDGE